MAGWHDLSQLVIMHPMRPPILIKRDIMETEPETVFTVSELNATARLVMEESFHIIWVNGEISNLSRPSSGHLYFSLKDERAQVRCAFFRNYHRQLNFTPENGQHVLVQAQVSLYEARGDFQLIVRDIQVAGSGVLQIAFEKLKRRLDKEGLFAPENKKSIPIFPHTIGVITSPSGAAIRDILTVLQRRFPYIPVIIYPTMVQGEKAAAQIVAAINTANQRQECDVILISRGGGSLEDLWPFNEEIVARAIFTCEIPVVTGIGHEIDFTIADFVADQRAATPSAAAERISPNRTEWSQQIKTAAQRLHHLINSQLHHHKLHLHNLAKRLQHPGRQLQEQARRIEALQHRLMLIMDHELNRQQQKLAAIAQTLQTISPLTTLKRGYAIVTHQNQIVRNAKQLHKGDRITAQLAKGYLACRVEQIIENKE